MIYDGTKVFAFYLEECKDNKKCLIFFNGLSFENPKLEDLKIFEGYLKNAIENYNEINDLIEKENQLYKEELNENPINSENIKKSKKSKKGYVYLAKCNHTKYYKIGFTSREVGIRIKELETTNPTLELYKFFPVKNKKEEVNLHEIFKDKEMRGEWFKLTPIDLRYIESYFSDSNNLNLIK